MPHDQPSRALPEHDPLLEHRPLHDHRPDLALLRHLLPRVTAAGSALATTVEEAGTPAEMVDAALPLPRLARAFRSPHLGCVAVHRADDDAVGLVTRARFFASVAGDLGFGRALLARAVAGDVADWSPLVLDGGTGIVEAALAMTSRPEESRYDAVLVRSPQWRVVAPSDLIRAVTALLAVRTLQDDLTGLPNAAAARLALEDRLRRSARTPHRVALVALRLEGGADAPGLEHGDATTDRVVARAVAHVRAAAPAGWDLARTREHELALLGTVPGPVAASDAAALLDHVQAACATTLRVDGTTVVLRSAAVCSPAGSGRAEELLRSARRRLAGVPTAGAPGGRVQPAREPHLAAR